MDYLQINESKCVTVFDEGIWRTIVGASTVGDTLVNALGMNIGRI
jgi:hypothetical protein